MTYTDTCLSACDFLFLFRFFLLYNDTISLAESCLPYCHTVKQDLAKYKSMDTTQVEAALKASTYLAKWVD